MIPGNLFSNVTNSKTINSAQKSTLPTPNHIVALTCLLLLNFKQFILASACFHRVFTSLHACQNLLLFQSPTDNLNTYWQTFHLNRVVVHVRASRHAVQFLDVEARRQLVKNTANFGDGNDAGGVVKLESRVSHSQSKRFQSARTKLNRNVYPQLLTAFFMALCGTAGVAFGAVIMKSMSLPPSGFVHHSCHSAL